MLPLRPAEYILHIINLSASLTHLDWRHSGCLYFHSDFWLAQIYWLRLLISLATKPEIIYFSYLRMTFSSYEDTWMDSLDCGDMWWHMVTHGDKWWHVVTCGDRLWQVVGIVVTILVTGGDRLWQVVTGGDI